MRPRLLDLFCGAGGAAMGYHRAGFDVVGVDLNPQPHYPFTFHQADAMTFRLEGHDAIHASPPCQRWTVGSPGRALGDAHPDLLTPTRARLIAAGVPYVIENVPGAPMPTAIMLCGSTFGLPIVRHRLFEIEPPIGLVPSTCHQRTWGRAVDHPGTHPYGHGVWRPAWRAHVLPVVWPWMTLEEAGQAIPPAYTEHIGHHLLAELHREGGVMGLTPLLDWQPYPGFGLVTVLCDGAEPDWWRALSPAEVADVWMSEIEQHALEEPDCQWRLVVEAPLHGEVYERRGPGRWVIIQTLDGFA